MATAKNQKAATASSTKKHKATKPKAETKKTPKATETKKVEVVEEKLLTEDTDSSNFQINEAGQPQQTERSNIMAKSDKEGYMVDDAGNRVLTADGQPILIRKIRKYNEANQLVDENGNVVLDKNGNPKMKPVRDVGQKTIARALRKKIDEANQILSTAKAKGILFELTMEPEADAPLVLGKMQIVEDF